MVFDDEGERVSVNKAPEPPSPSTGVNGSASSWDQDSEANGATDARAPDYSG